MEQTSECCLPVSELKKIDLSDKILYWGYFGGMGGERFLHDDFYGIRTDQLELEVGKDRNNTKKAFQKVIRKEIYDLWLCVYSFNNNSKIIEGGNIYSGAHLNRALDKKYNARIATSTDLLALIENSELNLNSGQQFDIGLIERDNSSKYLEQFNFSEISILKNNNAHQPFSISLPHRVLKQKIDNLFLDKGIIIYQSNVQGLSRLSFVIEDYLESEEVKKIYAETDKLVKEKFQFAPLFQEKIKSLPLKRRFILSSASQNLFYSDANIRTIIVKEVQLKS
ncbi:MAG: hypothetical protein ACOYT4_05335 [Nanoarchaeota archaeon]